MWSITSLMHVMLQFHEMMQRITHSVTLHNMKHYMPVLPVVHVPHNGMKSRKRTLEI